MNLDDVTNSAIREWLLAQFLKVLTLATGVQLRITTGDMVGSPDCSKNGHRGITHGNGASAYV